jgi:acetyl-CoA C-acetyltransferase
MVAENTPIIVGVGQITIRTEGVNAQNALSPQSLRARAVELALADSGQIQALRSLINKVIVVRTMADSVPGVPQPFGRCEAPAATLARHCHITDANMHYSVTGGDQPQALVNEASAAIFTSEAKAVLLAGSEATATLKSALKQSIELDWSETFGIDDDRGFGERMLSAYEIRNGLGAPTSTYPAFEHAVRKRLGRTRTEHAEVMANLWARLSKIAAQNPYAQYPVARDTQFLKTPSAENYPIADPYLKWHVAQDAVNQGAALILTSVGEAKRAGIDPSKWVFLHGYAQGADYLTSERPDLSRSDAISETLNAALTSSGKSIGDIQFLDLYSCFPCAVLLAAEALGIDPMSRDLTVTGGLPFFGGAGNNYSMHAIASMVEKLRTNAGDYGLVLANGGFLSKEAAGIYSTEPAQNWQPCDSFAMQAKLDKRAKPQLLSESCNAVIETYTVRYAKGFAKSGYVIAQTPQGRIIARNRRDDVAILAQMAERDPIGLEARIVHDDGVNYIEAFTG